MTIIFKWMNSPFVIGALLIFFSGLDLVLLGREFDLSKSDWASWVQAVGAVGAILITFSLARSQHRHERKLDEERQRDERNVQLDAQLLGRTVAVQNAVQIASFSLHAALGLVHAVRDEEPIWEHAQHTVQLEKLRTVLDSMISPSTEHLVVLSALNVALVITQTLADMSSVGGSMTEDLLKRSEDRINEAYDMLGRLIGLQGKLVDTCRSRGIPLEISDFTPRP